MVGDTDKKSEKPRDAQGPFEPVIDIVDADTGESHQLNIYGIDGFATDQDGLTAIDYRPNATDTAERIRTAESPQNLAERLNTGYEEQLRQHHTQQKQGEKSANINIQLGRKTRERDNTEERFQARSADSERSNRTLSQCDHKKIASIKNDLKQTRRGRAALALAQHTQRRARTAPPGRIKRAIWGLTGKILAPAVIAHLLDDRAKTRKQLRERNDRFRQNKRMEQADHERVMESHRAAIRDLENQRNNPDLSDFDRRSLERQINLHSPRDGRLPDFRPTGNDARYTRQKAPQPERAPTLPRPAPKRRQRPTKRLDGNVFHPDHFHGRNGPNFSH